MRVTPDELVCPRDRMPLAADRDALRCAAGHTFPLVDGIPLLLLEEEEPTHAWCRRSLELAESGRGAEPPVAAGADGVDPWVQEQLVHTCGRLYSASRGALTRYPIPTLPLPPGGGARFLEIGCNWGRWCIAAGRAGYRAVGIDPSLSGIAAARRVARDLGVDADFLVGDGRHLPFPDDTFDFVFSYSVLQHFPKRQVEATLSEAQRVLAPGGRMLVQIANGHGAASVAKRVAGLAGWRDPGHLRYWSPRELRETFERLVGPTRLSVDGFFTLNPQGADLDLLPHAARAVVRASNALRAASRRVPALVHVADSVYVEATKA
jgi:SAM-dependent methyltransferase